MIPSKTKQNTNRFLDLIVNTSWVPAFPVLCYAQILTTMKLLRSWETLLNTDVSDQTSLLMFKLFSDDLGACAPTPKLLTLCSIFIIALSLSNNVLDMYFQFLALIWYWQWDIQLNNYQRKKKAKPVSLELHENYTFHYSYLENTVKVDKPSSEILIWPTLEKRNGRVGRIGCVHMFKQALSKLLSDRKMSLLPNCCENWT